MITVDAIEGAAAPQEYLLGTLDELDDIASRRPTPEVSPESLRAAREMIASAIRRIDPPLRKSFVRPMAPESDPIAPMSQIYRGGRSGVVALKLYLALVWRCSAPPFSTEKPARAWATLLDLDDPAGNGARRIKNAMKTLAAANLIEMTDNPGYPNVVTLLDESGSGRAYELPSTAYTFGQKNGLSKDRLAQDMYFKVPQRLWKFGYIQSMSGPALVMLLILLAEQGGTGATVWFSTEEFPTRYNISHKTRAAGTRELREMGLLVVRAESLSSSSVANTFDVQRRRKIYRLTDLAQTAPDEVKAASAKAKSKQPQRRKKSAPRMSPR
ncbi:hypothetical protein HG717_35965 (plasmid) [Rhodococcus erythropolis]|uniref:hypothetical protein n=1 Tax=Rhodococcus erythropolis TaxID=1833 RepID=UPI001071BDED|nr:hypothetical protein [Rhodococcus erythropolis]MBY6389261.1 hypothetical protein [Rhodococcus erythropolis]